MQELINKPVFIFDEELVNKQVSRVSIKKVGQLPEKVYKPNNFMT